MIALDTPITVPFIRQTVERAWLWWTGELLQAIPIVVRNRIAPARPEFAIDLTRTKAVISTMRDGHLTECDEIDFGTSSEDDFARVATLFRSGPAPRVRLNLSNEMILRRELVLPRSAESRLRQIVGLDLDRQTPFTANNAAFDVVVRDRDKGAGRIRVELAVVKHETIELALSTCRQLSVYPESIGVGNSTQQIAGFNFLSALPGEKIMRSWRRSRHLPALVICLLFLLNIGLAFGRLNTRLEHLSAELTSARNAAQATVKLRSQLARSQSQARLLSEARGQANPLDILQELTHIFPDEVWLFQLETHDTSVQIAGLAPSAANLIERLDKSDRFTNPKFTASVTRSDKPGQDRFEIGFDLRPLASK